MCKRPPLYDHIIININIIFKIYLMESDHMLALEAKQAAYNKTHPNYYIYRGVIMGDPGTGRSTLAMNYTKDES
jgi:hypothetical protein